MSDYQSLKEVVNMMPFIIDSIGDKPQIYAHIIQLQMTNPEKISEELRDLSNYINGDDAELLRELADQYEKSSSNTPIILTIMGVLKDNGLLSKLLPNGKEIEAAKLMVGSKSKDMTDNQLSMYASAMISKPLWDKLPFMQSDKFNIMTMLNATRTSDGTYMSYLTGISTDEYQSLTERVTSPSEMPRMDLQKLQSPDINNMVING